MMLQLLVWKEKKWTKNTSMFKLFIYLLSCEHTVISNFEKSANFTAPVCLCVWMIHTVIRFYFVGSSRVQVHVHDCDYQSDSRPQRIK